MGIFNIFKRKVQVPSNDWLEAADREVDFTPDLWLLEQYEWQLLFVYDEMMQGHREYRKIKDQSFSAGDAFTVKPHELWKKKLGNKSFPIAIECTQRVPWRINHQKIRGEVYAVRPQVLIELDKYRLNGLEFERKRVRLLVPDKLKMWSRDGGEEERQTVKLIQAWMYVGIPDYWDDQIAHNHINMFDTVETFEGDKPYIAKYYYFTKKEYGG